MSAIYSLIHYPSCFSGTTALVALLRGDLLTVANVGDSRGVICDKNGKAIPLSYDHKPQQVRPAVGTHFTKSRWVHNRYLEKIKFALILIILTH